MSSGPGARYCEGCCSRKCEVCGRAYSRLPTSRSKTCSVDCGNRLGGAKRVGPRPLWWVQNMKDAQLKSREQNPEMWHAVARASSQRMRKKNPSHDPIIRGKIIETKRKNGTLGWLGRRGGNGTGPTKPQLLLHSLVGGELEFIVLCGRGRRRGGWPTCYKVDIGFPDYKLAVEIDGPTHEAPRQKLIDERRSVRLGLLGWRVLRFTNDQITKNPMKAARMVKSFMTSR